MFPVSLWTMSERVMNDKIRSNNGVEGWHNAFRNSLRCSHPSIWALLNALKKEEGLSETKMLQTESGVRPRKKKKYTEVNSRVKKLVENFNIDDIMPFLKGIARNLSF
jgi:hypothetical protein